MAESGHNTLIYTEHGGSKQTIASGGTVTFQSGATLLMEGGSTFTNAACSAVSIEDANNASVTDMLTLTHLTTGAPAAGIGAGIVVKIEDAGGSEEQARLNVVLTDVTNGAEDADITVTANVAGALKTVISFDADEGGAGGAKVVGIGSDANQVALELHPGTTAKGTLRFVAADSVGDTVTTVTNASMSAARTLTIPDPGAAASFVMTEGTATVNGVKTFGSVPVFPTGGITAGTTTLTEAELAVLDQASNASAVGAVGAAPASGTNTVTIVKTGNQAVLTFTLTSAQIPVTDGAGAGSYGSLKLFDFVEQAISFIGCRQNYTAFAEGGALTGGVGDASFEIGLGTTAIVAAANGTLGDAVIENVGQAIPIILAGGTGVGTAVDAARTAVDGTASALDLFLSWSGTAATIDANSTIDVTGTITVILALLGDD